MESQFSTIKLIFFLVFLVASGVLFLMPQKSFAAESLEQIDSVNSGYWGVDIVLDVNGYPMVTYYDSSNTNLNFIHCNDVDCAGGDDSVAVLDSVGDVGRGPQMVLDASGNPVISYMDFTNNELKLVHCSDPSCTAYSTEVVGSGGSSVVLSTANGGGYADVAFNTATGNPVLVLSENGTGSRHLKVIHCNDSSCAGKDESLEVVDAVSSQTGYAPSLVLDSSNHPVISYYDYSAGEIKLAHCNDQYCAGSNESISVIDASVDTGYGLVYTSLQLDSLGNPVIAYYARFTGSEELYLAHCDDVNCLGGGESINDTQFSSSALDFDLVLVPGTDLPVLIIGKVIISCNDIKCAGGDEYMAAVGGMNFPSSSGVLDSNDYPVLAISNSAAPVYLLHCDDVRCAPNVALSIHTQGDENGPVDIVYQVDLIHMQNFSLINLPLPGVLTFDLAFTGGTASTPSDYTDVSGVGVVSFGLGQSSATLTVPVIDDALTEPQETLQATISNPLDPFMQIDTATATATLDDNDGGNQQVNNTSGRGNSGTRRRLPIEYFFTQEHQQLTQGQDVDCPYLSTFLRKGSIGAAVIKLQNFLNLYVSPKVIVDGIFGNDTERAVKQFQAQYQEEILDPWNLDTRDAPIGPTGYVAWTTTRTINELQGCPVQDHLVLPNGVQINGEARVVVE